MKYLSLALAVVLLCSAASAITVTATREGLLGRRTASGLRIRRHSLFVALPSRQALGRMVIVRYGGRAVVAPVADVGPWSTHNPYWQTGHRPRRPGIDLSDELWRRLGVPWRIGHVRVDWSFRRG